MSRNGKNNKGGRPPGTFSEQTKAKMKAAEILREMIEDEIKELGKALLEKGKTGDVPAIKELFDRAFGKAPQAITGPEGQELVFKIVTYTKECEK